LFEHARDFAASNAEKPILQPMSATLIPLKSRIATPSSGGIQS
jgi:hypothetical protein